MNKKKYKKAMELLEKRIMEHKEKQRTAKSHELFYYREKEICKFENEKLKKQKWI